MITIPIRLAYQEVGVGGLMPLNFGSLIAVGLRMRKGKKGDMEIFLKPSTFSYSSTPTWLVMTIGVGASQLWGQDIFARKLCMKY